LLAGTEPNLRWRTFADGVAETAEGLGVEMVVTLGALIADVAHTLPVPITGLASDEQLVKRLDLTRSTYEGPTGVVGVVHDACGRKGISSASLWAAVPHYVAAVPNPKAALALLRRLEGLVGVAVEASSLEEEAESYESQVSRAVSANPEIEELVQRLEQEQSERLDILEDDVPSGEALARDFERYLRQQGND
jgi:predicted ATP-grasp superfamily ATP-dependent carboligase